MEPTHTAWPTQTGVSLLLAPLTYEHANWLQAVAVIEACAESFSVATMRGIEHCEPYVKAGALAMFGAQAEDVLVFRCPMDVGVNEAAPLVTAAESGAVPDVVGQFFRAVSHAALQRSERIAWVAAHEWSVGDRVRWASGDVERFVQFATSTGAWRTTFVSAPGRLFDSDEWPYWFEVLAARISFRQQSA